MSRSPILPVTIPPRLLDAIRQAAADAELSMAEWLRQAAREKLNRHGDQV